VFAHGARVSLGAQDGPATGSVELFGCFHVSQRNTFTGRLTPAMLRAVLRTAAGTAGLTTRPYDG
jgi:uracil-DNA glycosylase